MIPRLKTSPLPENTVQLGTLGKTFGLKGGVYFYALGEAEQLCLESLPHVYLAQDTEKASKLKVLEVKPHGNKYLVFFVGLSKVNAIRLYTNATVYVDEELLPETEGFYFDLLLDLPVYVDGAPLGDIIEITSVPQQDLAHVETATGEVHLIPLQADYVTIAEDGIYLESPPEGLLEL